MAKVNTAFGLKSKTQMYDKERLQPALQLATDVKCGKTQFLQISSMLLLRGNVCPYIPQNTFISPTEGTFAVTC